MEHHDFEKFRLKSVQPKTEEKTPTPLPRHRKGEYFLAGPIPWNWWSRAAQVSGKSLHVASALWLIAMMEGRPKIQLQGRFLRQLGVSRKAVYRILKELEKAGLIACYPGPGRRPIVTILDVPEHRSASNG